MYKTYVTIIYALHCKDIQFKKVFNTLPTIRFLGF